MRRKIREARSEWAKAHGWSYAPTASLAPDILSGVITRTDIEVDDHMCGMFSGRPAFVHERGGIAGRTQPSQFFRAVSAVDAGAPVPRAYTLIGRDAWWTVGYDLQRRAFLAPHVRGMVHVARPGGTHIWCEPAGVQALLWALAPLLEAGPPPAPAPARRARMLIASEGQTVYVCDQLSYNVESDIQRLQLAHELGARYAHLMRGAAATGADPHPGTPTESETT